MAFKLKMLIKLGQKSWRLPFLAQSGLCSTSWEQNEAMETACNLRQREETQKVTNFMIECVAIKNHPIIYQFF